MTAVLDSSDLWDRRYLDGGGHPYGVEPDPIVAAEAAKLPPGDALDLGAGDGRNALWLLDRGWRVTAVDLSPVALSELVGASWGERHDLVAIRADLRAWRPPPDSADLVLLSFVSLPAAACPAFYRAAAAAVRPGGRLVLLSGAANGPDPTHAARPTVDEVTANLPGLTIDRATVRARSSRHEDLVVVAHRR